MHHGTVGTVANLEFSIRESGLKSAVRIYAVSGFHVIMIVVDGQFKSFKDRNNVGTHMNIESKG